METPKTVLYLSPQADYQRFLYLCPSVAGRIG